MNSHLRFGLIVSFVVILALLFSAVTPRVVFAEGEAPESPPLTEPPEEQQPAQDVSSAVQDLAEQNAVVVQDGQVLPMAAQSTLAVICEPDPWFFGSLCAGGKCAGASGYTTINLALADWAAKKGYGMIYLEGGNVYNENVVIDGSQPGMLTLKGLVIDASLNPTAPVINGQVNVYGLKSGFALQGITINANVGDVTNTAGAVYIHDNSGLIKLTDVKVTNSNVQGGGIAIDNFGAVELLRVEATDNGTYGAYIHNSIDPFGDNLATGTVKITNSSFNFNGNGGSGPFAGLEIYSGSSITLNGVSASANNGDGLDILGKTVTTIKNSVFSLNAVDPDTTDWGYGIYVYPENKSAFIIDNISASYNENDGLFLTSPGNITISKLQAVANGDTGLRIQAVDDNASVGVGGKNISLTDSILNSNGYTNVLVYANGSITLKNVNASYSAAGSGISLVNTAALTPLPVMASNITTVRNSGGYGLYILSNGNITVDSITSSLNDASGVYADNTYGTTGGITFLSTYGKNLVDQNSYIGMELFSKQSIKIVKLTSAYNLYEGIVIDMDGGIGNLSLNTVSVYANGGWGITADLLGSIVWNASGAAGNGRDPALNGGGAKFDNHLGVGKSIALSNVDFSENAGNDGLYIDSAGNVTLTNISAATNTGRGIYIDNRYGTGNVSILRTAPEDRNYVSFNQGIGLTIYTNRNVTLAKISVSYNTDLGAYINTCNGAPCVGTGTVTITGSNNAHSEFSYNEGLYGLQVVSAGAVKLAMVESSQNQFDGAYVTTNSTFTMNGLVNRFDYNGLDSTGSGSGLIVLAQGTIAVWNTQAKYNDGIGLDLSNNLTLGDVVINASSAGWENWFSFNNGSGVEVETAGNIILNKSTFSSNGLVAGNGASLVNSFATAPKSVTVTNSKFSNNNLVGMAYSGLYVDASGAIALNNIEASGNGLYGIQLDNRVGTDLAKPVTVSNSIFGGNIGDGVNILSDRAVAITSVRSTFSNTGVGIKIDNSTSTVASMVTFLGTNLFTYNSENGIEIKSAGIVSIANTTTAYNSWNGMQIETAGSVLLSNDRAERNGTDGVWIKSANNQITLSGVTSMLNGFLGDWNGLQIDSTTAKVTISNSNFVGNSAWGITADVVNPTSDVILNNTNTFGNDLGADFMEGNVYIY
jgi:hypothetical protein